MLLRPCCKLKAEKSLTSHGRLFLEVGSFNWSVYTMDYFFIVYFEIGAGSQLIMSIPHGALNFLVTETTKARLSKASRKSPICQQVPHK